MSAAKGEVGQWITDISSLEHIVKVAESKLKDAQENLGKYRFELAKAELAKEKLDKELNDLRERKAGEEAILREVQRVLKKNPGKIKVAGREYTLEEVREDALRRHNRCRALKTRIEEEAALMRSLSMRIENAKQRFSQCLAKINELKVKIREWQARIAAKQTAIKLAELTSALEGDPLAESDVAEAINALREVETKYDAKLKTLGETALSQEETIVPWEKQNQPDVSKAISEYFKKGGKGSVK